MNTWMEEQMDCLTGYKSDVVCMCCMCINSEREQENRGEREK